MKNRLLPLALAGLAAFLGAEPAAAQRSYGGKASYAQSSKGLHITKPTSKFGSYRPSTYSSVSNKPYGSNSKFGVSYSKPGFSISVGSGYGSVSASTSARVWVPGYWSSVREQVWIPATTKKVWYPPVYATQFDACRQPYQVMTQAGYYKTVQVPGYYDIQPVRKWVAGTWRY